MKNTEQIKKNRNLLQNKFEQFKKRLDLLEKRQSLLEKGLEQIAKMQNLSQNESNQVTTMHNQSRDELEHVAQMRRIKNRKRMSKEELIIALLKSKRGLAELFNNNLDDGKISDIRRILNRLRDVLPKRIRKEIKKKAL